MNDFTLIVQGHTLKWEYQFSMNTTEEAIAYAKEQTLQFAGVRWFHALLLYQEKEHRSVFLGKFTIDQPTVTMR